MINNVFFFDWIIQLSQQGNIAALNNGLAPAYAFYIPLQLTIVKAGNLFHIKPIYLYRLQLAIKLR